MEKTLTVPKIGDIVASNVSGGFIETVVSVHKTNDTEYLETEFQRCNEYSQLNATRYSANKIHFLKNNVTGYVMLRNMTSAKYYSTSWKKHKYVIYIRLKCSIQKHLQEWFKLWYTFLAIFLPYPSPPFLAM